MRFLVELSFNNDKAWFDRHRAEYQALREAFVHFVSRVVAETARFDSSVAGVQPRDCLFRINRDTRFSNNKSPYKTHFSAAIGAGGRHSSGPLYYLQISGPAESLVAGGVWMPDSSRLSDIRAFIKAHQSRSDAVLYDETLLEAFGGLDTQARLTRYPKGFDSGSELLKYRSFTVARAFDPLAFDEEGLLEHVAEGFLKMQPLMKFVREAK